MWSITRRALRGAWRTYFARANGDVDIGLATGLSRGRLLAPGRCLSAATAARCLRLGIRVLGLGLALGFRRLGLGLLLGGLLLGLFGLLGGRLLRARAALRLGLLL